MKKSRASRNTAEAFLLMRKQTTVSHSGTDTPQRLCWSMMSKVVMLMNRHLWNYKQWEIVPRILAYTFRKNMQQEKEKQCIDPIWRLKHNVDAQIQVSKEWSIYKQEWMWRHQQIELGNIAAGLGGFSLWCRCKWFSKLVVVHQIHCPAENICPTNNPCTIT